MKAKRIVISLLSTLVLGAQMALAAGTPENVSGIEATPIDGTSIGLTWDTAKDAEDQLLDHYRIYYGATSVFEAGEGVYDSELDTPNNNTSYVVADLDPETTYYFSVTGFSSDEIESEEYSFEISATTLSDEGGEGEGEGEGEGDTTSPTVTSVLAPDKLHVKVVFSEPVNLPALFPETSFSVVEQINPANSLEVVTAITDPDDVTGKTILIETSEQTANVNYIVTVGVSIKDLAGNPMVSGSTDSGLFLGSANEPPVIEAEEEAAEEEVVEELLEEAAGEEEPAEGEFSGENCDKDLGCFVSHLADCSSAMVMQADDQYEYKLELTGEEATNCTVMYTAEKHPSILFGGTDMTCNITKGNYTPESYGEAFDIANCSGSLVNGYEAVEVKDTTPPEDITNLLLTFREQLEKFVVILNWTPSVNSAKDLVDQIVYMSLDRGTTYDSGKSLGPVVAKSEVGNLDAGKEYTFKLAVKDSTGNESVGVVKSIRLPSTGVGVGIVIVGSALAARHALRRKEEDL